jgi:hypothetical protein
MRRAGVSYCVSFSPVSLDIVSISVIISTPKELVVPDGPFKNSQLDRHSKRFGNSVLNASVDLQKRRALAENAILVRLLNETGSLVGDVALVGSERQMAVDPHSLIGRVFDGHAKSQFGDGFEREVAYRLSEGQPPATAISQGLHAAIGNYVGEFGTRMNEAALAAVEAREMTRSQYQEYVTTSRQVLEGIDRSRILDALTRGDRSAYKMDLAKKTGVDEGLPL